MLYPLFSSLVQKLEQSYSSTINLIFKLGTGVLYHASNLFKRNSANASQAASIASPAEGLENVVVRLTPFDPESPLSSYKMLSQAKETHNAAAEKKAKEQKVVAEQKEAELATKLAEEASKKELVGKLKATIWTQLRLLQKDEPGKLNPLHKSALDAYEALKIRDKFLLAVESFNTANNKYHTLIAQQKQPIIVDPPIKAESDDPISMALAHYAAETEQAARAPLEQEIGIAREKLEKAENDLKALFPAEQTLDAAKITAKQAKHQTRAEQAIHAFILHTAKEKSLREMLNDIPQTFTEQGPLFASLYEKAALDIFSIARQYNIDIKRLYTQLGKELPSFLHDLPDPTAVSLKLPEELKKEMTELMQEWIKLLNTPVDDANYFDAYIKVKMQLATFVAAETFTKNRDADNQAWFNAQQASVYAEISPFKQEDWNKRDKKAEDLYRSVEVKQVEIESRMRQEVKELRYSLEDDLELYQDYKDDSSPNLSQAFTRLNQTGQYREFISLAIQLERYFNENKARSVFWSSEGKSQEEVMMKIDSILENYWESRKLPQMLSPDGELVGRRLPSIEEIKAIRAELQSEKIDKWPVRYR